MRLFIVFCLCLFSAFLGSYYTYKYSNDAKMEKQIEELKIELKNKVDILGNYTEDFHNKLKNCLREK